MSTGEITSSDKPLELTARATGDPSNPYTISPKVTGSPAKTPAWDTLTQEQQLRAFNQVDPVPEHNFNGLTPIPKEETQPPVQPGPNPEAGGTPPPN